MISPELQKQINATPRDGVLAAVIVLKAKPEPGEPTNKAVKDLLKKVEHVGRPSAVNVFDKICTFLIVGSPSFIQYLAMQPEVDRAISNGP